MCIQCVKILWVYRCSHCGVEDVSNMVSADRACRYCGVGRVSIVGKQRASIVGCNLNYLYYLIFHGTYSKNQEKDLISKKED